MKAKTKRKLNIINDVVLTLIAGASTYALLEEGEYGWGTVGIVATAASIYVTKNDIKRYQLIEHYSMEEQ